MDNIVQCPPRRLNPESYPTQNRAVPRESRGPRSRGSCGHLENCSGPLRQYHLLTPERTTVALAMTTTPGELWSSTTFSSTVSSDRVVSKASFVRLPIPLCFGYKHSCQLRRRCPSRKLRPHDKMGTYESAGLHERESVRTRRDLLRMERAVLVRPRERTGGDRVSVS